jgi:hypothetical protein
VIVKFAVVAPVATVTVAGTLATALLLPSATGAGNSAADASVTVPVVVVPPPTLPEVVETDAIEGLIVTVRFAVALRPCSSVAVTVKLNAPLCVGVPEITPVLLSANPVGSAPCVIAHVNKPTPPLAFSVAGGNTAFAAACGRLLDVELIST